tara:strand:+ start:1452 stop:1613 length:162 start_codon:yes stop_codon:yes gene_type:complete
MKKKWILNMDISFAFNGTEEDAKQKLKEDMEFLENDVFTRDGTEYIINNSEII